MLPLQQASEAPDERKALPLLTLRRPLAASFIVVIALASCSKEESRGEATPNPISEDTTSAQQSTPTPSIATDPTGITAPAKPQTTEVDPYVLGGPNGFIPLWQCIAPTLQCIAPTLRPTVPDADALKRERPNASQLTEGLLDMVFMREQRCVENLLDGGADVNAVRTPADGFDAGPSLHLALNQRNWELAKYLLNRGADPNIMTPYEGPTGDGGGYTALDMAYGSFAPEDVITEIKKRGGKVARY